MKGMTATQIQSRLAEIDSEQTAFDSRDFDAELSQVIVNGGNVDALEEQHLQAERLARRLRVERQALESALPETMISESSKRISELVEQHNDMVEQHHSKGAELVATLAQLEAQLADFTSLRIKMRDAAFSADGEATKIEKRTGQTVTIPPLIVPSYAPLKDRLPFLAKAHGLVSSANASRHDRGIKDNLTYQSGE